MKASTKSFHYTLYSWVCDYYHLGVRSQISLCPYFHLILWGTLGTVVLFPFFALGTILAMCCAVLFEEQGFRAYKEVCPIQRAVGGLLVTLLACVLAGLGWLFTKLLGYISGHIGTFTIGTIIVVSIVLYGLYVGKKILDWEDVCRKAVEDEQPIPEPPVELATIESVSGAIGGMFRLIWAFLKAAKKRVCPLVEFSDNPQEPEFSEN